MLVTSFCYAQFAPPHALGWAFGADTVRTVLGQLVTLRLTKGRRRTSMLAVCASGGTEATPRTKVAPDVVLAA